MAVVSRPGSTREGAAQRREAFVAAYLSNGRNATQAAITAGYAAHSARQRGCMMLSEPRVAARVAEANRSAMAVAGAVVSKQANAMVAAGLTVERTLQEVARLAYSDPRKMFRPDGSMIPIAEMDDDTAACVASFKHDTFDGGEEGESGSTTKLKVWDKNAALEKAMKHLGLYERDNSQRAPNLALQIVLVGPV